MVKAYNKVIDEDYTNLPYLEKPGIVKIHSKVNDRICDVVNYIEQKDMVLQYYIVQRPQKRMNMLLS